jgi:hypothetical protein
LVQVDEKGKLIGVIGYFSKKLKTQDTYYYGSASFGSAKKVCCISKSYSDKKSNH